jgi:hypothetical protein
VYRDDDDVSPILFIMRLVMIARSPFGQRGDDTDKSYVAEMVPEKPAQHRQIVCCRMGRPSARKSSKFNMHNEFTLDLK